MYLSPVCQTGFSWQNCLCTSSPCLWKDLPKYVHLNSNIASAVCFYLIFISPALVCPMKRHSDSLHLQPFCIWWKAPSFICFHSSFFTFSISSSSLFMVLVHAYTKPRPHTVVFDKTATNQPLNHTSSRPPSQDHSISSSALLLNTCHLLACTQASILGCVTYPC